MTPDYDEIHFRMLNRRADDEEEQEEEHEDPDCDMPEKEPFEM